MNAVHKLAYCLQTQTSSKYFGAHVFSLFWGIVGSVLTDLSSDDFEVRVIIIVSFIRKVVISNHTGQLQ